MNFFAFSWRPLGMLKCHPKSWLLLFILIVFYSLGAMYLLVSHPYHLGVTQLYQQSVDSTSSRLLYVIASPNVDTDWNGTTIFGRYGDFVITGYIHPTTVIYALRSLLLSNLGKRAESVTICISTVNCSIFKPSHGARLLTESPKVTGVFMSIGGEKRTGILFSRLIEISPSTNGDNQYLFCHGMSERFFSTTMQKTNCPPCICPAVFETRTFNDRNLAQTATKFSEKFSDGSIEDDIAHANSLFKHSRFIGCPSQYYEIDDHSQIFLDGETPQFPSSYAWAIREFFRINGMQIGLDSGTLLGWYRNCSIIPGDVDLDFIVPHSKINTSFYHTILETVHDKGRAVRELLYLNRDGSNETLRLKSTRIFGDLTSSVEVRFEVSSALSKPVVGADIFVLHNDEPNLNYTHTNGFVVWNTTIIEYLLPKNLTICSTIFLRDLYLVPCEPEAVLSSNYGPNWQRPAKRLEGSWYRQPNARQHHLSPTEWKTRKMYKGFKSK